LDALPIKAVARICFSPRGNITVSHNSIPRYLRVRIAALYDDFPEPLVLLIGVKMGIGAFKFNANTKIITPLTPASQ